MIVRAVMMLVNATDDPTDKSNPAQRMVSICPHVMMAKYVACRLTVIMFEKVMNRLSATVNKMSRVIRRNGSTPTLMNVRLSNSTEGYPFFMGFATERLPLALKL
jgi:hypothetical protein